MFPSIYTHTLTRIFHSNIISHLNAFFSSVKIHFELPTTQFYEFLRFLLLGSEDVSDLWCFSFDFSIIFFLLMPFSLS